MLKRRTSAPANDAGTSSHTKPLTNERVYHTVIVGGGFAGVGAAIRLLQAGFDDFVLLEKASELGGVWRENTYPGCACDVPSALYSYSFAPNPRWSRLFAGQAEIKQYLQDTAARFKVMPHVHCGQEALRMAWQNDANLWEIQTPTHTLRSQFMVLACGPMHEPVLPNIPGLPEFKGEVFHSSRWNHAVDLTGKRVAVIGTGASAIQFVPAIQPKVAELTVFQRTPQWVLPKLDQSLPRWVQLLFKALPTTQQALRGATYGIFETLNGSMQSLKAMQQIQKVAQWNLERTVKDPALRAQLTPDYVLGCKRVLQSNQWYPALVQPNVRVCTSALAQVDGHTLIADNGEQVEVDVIILGTGFEIAEPPIAQRVHGRDGRSMADVWQGSPEGYMGTLVEGCPNGFLMFGPNIAVSSSAFIIIEAQLDYIVDAMEQIRAKGLKTVEPRPDLTARYNAAVQAALENTVWNAGGCQSYFIDRNGRNSTVWPWTTLDMKRRLSRFNVHEYITHA